MRVLVTRFWYLIIRTLLRLERKRKIRGHRHTLENGLAQPETPLHAWSYRGPQDYLGAWIKKKQKIGGMSRRKKGAGEEESDAFGNDAWADDAEHRALCHMATRLLIAADGPCGCARRLLARLFSVAFTV